MIPNTLTVSETNHMVDDEKSTPMLALERFDRIFPEHRGEMWLNNMGITYTIRSVSDEYVFGCKNKADKLIQDNQLPLTTTVTVGRIYSFLNVKYRG